MTRLVLSLGVASLVGYISVAYLDALPKVLGLLFWLVVVSIAAGVCGYRHPRAGWQWGFYLSLVQPLCFALFMLVVGELVHPGGYVSRWQALLLVTWGWLLASVIPAFTGHRWARVRAGELLRSGSPPGQRA